MTDRHLRRAAGRQAPAPVARGRVARRAAWPTLLGTASSSRDRRVRGQRRSPPSWRAYGADRVHVFDDAASPRTPPSRTRAPWLRSSPQSKPAAVLIPFTAHGQGPGAARRGARSAPASSPTASRLERQGRPAGGPAADVRGQGLRDRGLGRRAADGDAARRTCSRSARRTRRGKAEVVTAHGRRHGARARWSRSRRRGGGQGRADRGPDHRLRRPRSQGPGELPPRARAGRGVRRRRGRLARGGRRGLGRPPAAGRARPARRCRRRSTSPRDQRRDPAPGRHVVLEVHRGHQQGRRRADLQGGELRHRRRRVRGRAEADRGRQGATSLEG